MSLSTPRKQSMLMGSNSSWTCTKSKNSSVSSSVSGFIPGSSTSIFSYLPRFIRKSTSLHPHIRFVFSGHVRTQDGVMSIAPPRSNSFALSFPTRIDKQFLAAAIGMRSPSMEKSISGRQPAPNSNRTASSPRDFTLPIADVNSLSRRRGSECRPASSHTTSTSDAAPFSRNRNSNSSRKISQPIRTVFPITFNLACAIDAHLAALHRGPSQAGASARARHAGRAERDRSIPECRRARQASPAAPRSLAWATGPAKR